jgi:protein-S-isoprenylcysteine O-methyltransferase Ste14
MRPIFFDQPIYGAIFGVACAIWYVPELIGTFFQRARRRNGTRHDRGSYAVLIGVLWLGLLLGFGIAALVPWAAILVLRLPLFWLGIGGILVGVALRWYAIRVLGRFFTRDVATHAGQTVVQEGPYRFIRHPAYSGTLLTLLGIGLTLGNGLALLVVLIGGVSGHLYRVHVEEQALVAALGEPYRAYMRGTRRFIPFVW